MEKMIVICDKCKSEFDERVPSVDPIRDRNSDGKTCRRDCRIHFKGGMIGLDFCLKCEETVTVAEARRLAAERAQII